MQRITFLGVAILAIVTSTTRAEDPVYFADPDLKAVVAARLGVANPTPSDMLKLTSLQEWGEPISDLTGLEYATNLTYLHLQDSGISDISRLADLQKLTDLNLGYNQISDVSALSGLANLRILALLGNERISDVSPLSGLTGLTQLWLGYNQISDISGLAGLVNLSDLLLAENHITDLSPLAGLSKLTRLDLGYNEVTDISVLAGLPNLSFLDLYGNSISDISSLAGLTNLTDLDLGSNNIGDISALAGLTGLTKLYLFHNGIISDIRPLSGLEKLTLLYLTENQITDISALSGLTELTDLSLTFNEISDISPLSGLLKLRALYLSRNQISDISALCGLGNLTNLNLQYNPLNNDAYCTDLPRIVANNPGASITYSINDNPPSGVSASDGAYADKVRITWDSLCSSGYNTRYRVYRAESPGGMQKLVTNWQLATVFDDTTALPDVIYYYWVSAETYDSSGNYNYTDQSSYDTGWRSSAAVLHILTISSTAGGAVIGPGEGTFSYSAGGSVSVTAAAATNYRFTGWTGTAVAAGQVADPASAATTVTMAADYTLVANFVYVPPIVRCTLTASAGEGGHVLAPGEGAFGYDKGTAIEITAQADSGYRFTLWTGSAVTEGKVADPRAAHTTLTIDADYLLRANFEPAEPAVPRILTVSSGAGGRVTQPGAGSFVYDGGTSVWVMAQADSGYLFWGWTGSAVKAGKVGNPASATTSVWMDGDYDLRANYVAVGQASVQVLAPNGGESLSSGATASIRWRVQGPVASVNIELSVDDGATWTSVCQREGSAGACDWTVPWLRSDCCLIRISVAQNASVSDISDAPFRIQGTTLYVDAAAVGAGDGSSWPNAFVCLQDALAQAVAGDSIWIAEGSYWPDLGEGCQAGNRAATFRLKDGVALYGGFPTGGGAWSQRNPARYPSVLTGDIGQAGVPGDNSYHVVTGSNTDRTAVLDGCVITGGYADGEVGYVQGAGMYNRSGSPTVRNCTFVGNTTPMGPGGGAYNANSQAMFVNCIFNSNTAGKYGGGLACDEGGDVAVVNCTFVANRGLMRAGGVFNNAGTTTVTNCVFWGNIRVGEICDEWAQASGDPYPVINYCCLQGRMGMLGGQGNLGDDPLFVDVDGPDDVAGTLDDDLRLSGGSPCLDRGDNTAVPPEAATDLAGRPRILNGIVDLGAFEFDADSSPETP